MKQTLPYGLWPSPITASQVSQRTRLNEVIADPNGPAMVWLEGRSGKNILLAQAGAAAPRELTPDHSPRGGVGYGGGAFDLNAGLLVFVDNGGRLFRLELAGGAPRPITPPFGSAGGLALSPDGRWVLFAHSDGASDVLALVDSAGQEWPVKVAQGADFYMHPAWSPDQQRIAWVEWDHPNMPWDGARLMLADLAGEPPRAARTRQIGGGPAVSAAQPRFSPDGRWLAFIEADGEWENLILIELASGERRVLLAGDGFHLCEPDWIQGQQTLAWSRDSRALYSIRNARGFAELWRVDLDSAAARVDVSPYTWLSQLSVAQDGALAFIGSAVNTPTHLVKVEAAGLRVAARSGAENTPAEYFAPAQELTWTAPDGSPVYGLYYPPTHPHFTAHGLPPAQVSIHGGPTSQAVAALSIERAFFTSRGWGWLDVNYRGSSGYGRGYRDALRQRWGAADVEDAAGAAQALSEQGLADPAKLVIRGGSAGGYTVLNTLIHHPGLYKAGVCLYGVGNLFALNLETHKFEAHYNDSLVGVLPADAERFHAWSPAFHLSGIRDALAVFQGKEDRVVPPSQAEEIVSHLQRQGIPYVYRLYEGEGHGFRKSETVSDFLQQVERFLQIHVLFAR